MPYTYYGDDANAVWPRGIIFHRFALNLVQVLLQSAWRLSIIIYATLEELVMDHQLSWMTVVSEYRGETSREVVATWICVEIQEHVPAICLFVSPRVFVPPCQASGNEAGARSQRRG